MRIGDLLVDCYGDRVEITRGGFQVATGRWHAGRIIERSGTLVDGDDQKEWTLIENCLRQEADAFISQQASLAYDARGVDTTQIDYMLSLTPRERLKALETHVSSILRLIGDAPRD